MATTFVYLINLADQWCSFDDLLILSSTEKVGKQLLFQVTLAMVGIKLKLENYSTQGTDFRLDFGSWGCLLLSENFLVS